MAIEHPSAQIHLSGQGERDLVTTNGSAEPSSVGVFRSFLIKEGPDNLSQEVKVNTPKRYVDAFRELMGYNDEAWEFTTFPSSCDEMVIVQNIAFCSLCEHHLLPFVGRAHVGYLPQGRIAGLSKIARTVLMYSRGLWTQEELTTAIAKFLRDALNPIGVGVVMEAEHTCMSIRGVKSSGASTTTSAMLGAFRDKPEARAEFRGLIGR